MKTFLCLALAAPLCAFALPAAPAVATGSAPLLAGQDNGQATGELPSDEDLRKAWDALSAEDKGEIAEWFRAESDYLKSTQNALIKYLLTTEERDRGTWPEFEPLPPYDPEVHAPKQPIARKWLAADSTKAQKAREQFAPDIDPLKKAYIYNWATGEINRVADERDPELIFENALMGLPPKTDYAEALLMRLLDDGEKRALHAAFAHPYTDRTGNVFPGVTLYDAWGSGSQMEMPDVDVLGIVHELLDEWKKWTAPVPDTQHKKLYGEVGDLWTEAYQHRSLREAFATSFLRGKALPANSYASMTLAFNAKWEEHSSDPHKLLDELPEPKKWEKYTKDLTGDIAKSSKKKYRDAGQVRLDYLEYERYKVKATLVWVMTQYGALK